jgi:kynurenine formamidase
MPVYPGHLPTVVFQFHTHEGTLGMFEGDFSYASNGLMFSDHGPTHVDSFNHFDPSPDAPSIDEMPIDLFVGDGTCLDISATPARGFCSADDLDRALEAQGSLLEPGDVLLLHTGAFARHGGTAEYATEYPGLDESAAEWLVQKQVKIFGVDCPSPDSPASRNYPVHLMCRRERLTHYENLANLDQLIGKRFAFVGLPLNIRAGYGSPVRAVAFLSES